MDINVQQCDWLIPHNCDDPHRIKEISYQEDPSGRYPIITFEGKGFWGVWYYPQNCKPIPITSEILEKNGFVRSNVFVEWKYENDNVYMIYKPFPYLKIQTEECFVAFPCEYIHQLQHALRLCGIDKTIEL